MCHANGLVLFHVLFVGRLILVVKMVAGLVIDHTLL